MKKFFVLLIGFLATLLPMFANERPIEFTVMHSAGGVSDLTSRYIVNNLKNKYIIVNRPGANGRIAINHLLKEHTVIMANIVPVFVTNPLSTHDRNQDPLMELEVIATVGIMPSALVCNKKTGFNNFEDFRNSSKILSSGVGGIGSNEHLATEMLAIETKLPINIIPYPMGGNKSISDLVGGHIDCIFANYPTIKSFISDENLTLIMTSHNLGYNVVTWKEVYKKEFPFQSYQFIVVPKSMNSQLKNQISLDFIDLFSDQKFRQGILQLGLFPTMETDKKKIARTVAYASDIRKFILDNNIKIGD